MKSAIEILKKTNYKILPSRILTPDLYDAPPESMQSKRAVLLGLSPMLTDAEKQKKIDGELCTKFTRCTSYKGKGRCGQFEYFDLDTQSVMEYENYQKRYARNILYS